MDCHPTIPKIDSVCFQHRQAAAKNILGIAKHKYGCATLQRCLETG